MCWTRDELTTLIPSSELYRVGSLYSRLLDEDVVIEQRYTEQSNSIVVNFTYEAFMEYVLGGLVHLDHERNRKKVETFLSRWHDEHQQFPNAAGVVGFFTANLFDSNRDYFFDAVNWLQSTANDGHLYSLQIALDNLPPEEFDRRIFSLLLTRLTRAKDPFEHPPKYSKQRRVDTIGDTWTAEFGKSSEVFGPSEAFRILLRTPPTLSDTFNEALTEIAPVTGLSPLLWARVFEHFGQRDPSLMWKAIRLRLSTRQPLRKFTLPHARRVLAWLEQSDAHKVTSGNEPLIQDIIQRWYELRNEIRLGRYGGWDDRTVTLDKFIKLLKRNVADQSSNL